MLIASHRVLTNPIGNDPKESKELKELRHAASRECSYCRMNFETLLVKLDQQGVEDGIQRNARTVKRRNVENPLILNFHSLLKRLWLGDEAQLWKPHSDLEVMLSNPRSVWTGYGVREKRKPRQSPGTQNRPLIWQLLSFSSAHKCFYQTMDGKFHPRFGKDGVNLS